jgi:Fur family peroxide stress response transcriptional regulator
MQQVTRKRSRKRDAILACLRATKSHPSADQIYAELKPQIPDLSLGTVYRNLTLFRQEGTIASVGVVNGLERFDADVSPHMHFVCTCCGAVVDVGASPAELTGLAAAVGTVTDCRVTFTGICHSCASGAVSA